MEKDIPTQDAVLNRIRAYRQTAGLTITGLARRANIWEAALREMDSDTWNPKAETVRKLEAVVDGKEPA